jgi:predicted acyltransferase
MPLVPAFRPPLPDAARGQSLQRRRRLLGVLLAAAVMTFLAAVVAAQPGVWGVQVLVDVLLVGYLALLIHARNVSAGVEMSHRSLGR